MPKDKIIGVILDSMILYDRGPNDFQDFIIFIINGISMLSLHLVLVCRLFKYWQVECTPKDCVMTKVTMQRMAGPPRMN